MTTPVSTRITRVRAIAPFLAGVLLGASVGLASAAIPASGTGVFYACYDARGNVRFIDNAVATTCPRGFTGPVTWNQIGPQGHPGEQGEQGPAGPQGEQGPSIASIDDLAGVACQTSSFDGYAGKVVVASNAGTISLTCTVSPTGVGAANPASVPAGGVTELIVAVSPGLFPMSTWTNVVADLTPIGGSATQAFFDDGTSGDVIPGDSIFTFRGGVSPDTAIGFKDLAVTILDDLDRSSTTSISLDVTLSP
jgi:hypothetical protein